MVRFSVIAHLRAATEAAHRALDGDFGVVDRLSLPAERPAMLRRYHAMHAAAEAAMTPFLVADADFAARRRAPLIARVRADGPPAGPALRIACRGAALGVLYVMEGSTLGGRLILRDLRTRGVRTDDLGFLDPYGAQSSAMFRALADALERELGCNPPALASAVQGAAAAFAHAGLCLYGAWDVRGSVARDEAA